MKRLLDRLMYKLGYVTHERYFRAAAPKIARALDRVTDEEWFARVDATSLPGTIVITTDYRKGIPCS